MNTDKHGLKAVAMGVVLMAAAASLPAVAATPVPSGKWSFVFTDRRGQADRPVRVYTYRPRQCDSTCPMLFVLHGAKRDASAFRDYWELPADRHGFLVVAPEFSEKHWPEAQSYDLGDVAGNANREKWAYSVIEHLFDEMRDGQKDYRLFGHAAGAQFVHRLMLLRADNRASLAVVANAGWYAVPEWRKDKKPPDWPLSLLGTPAGEAEVRAALGKRLVVMLGEADTADDASVEKGGDVAKQGGNPVERGENFLGAATTAARELGVKLAWELSYVPGVGRDDAKMSRAAADVVGGVRK